MVSGVGHRAVYFNQFYCWIKKQNHQTRKTACVTYECTIITACQRSCGKVMFSQVSVCSRGEGGYSGPMSLFGGGWDLVWWVPPSPHPPRHGTSWVGMSTPTPPKHGIQCDTVGKRAIRILLECFLVHLYVYVDKLLQCFRTFSVFYFMNFFLLHPYCRNGD